MQEEVMSLTRFWNTQMNKHAHKNTHTQTGKTLYALPPFHGGDMKTLCML